MKTFKQFLQEEHSKVDAELELIKPLAERVKKECADWLEKSGKRQVWRGLKNSSRDAAEIIPFDRGTIDPEITLDFVMNDPARIVKTRQDRRPKDSSPNDHHRLNNAFEKHFKTRYREQAVFASPSESFASDYGQSLFAVYPRGECNFIWSSVLYDAITFKDENDIFSGFFDTKRTDFAKHEKLFKIMVEFVIEQMPDMHDTLKEMLRKTETFGDDIKSLFWQYHHYYHENENKSPDMKKYMRDYDKIISDRMSEMVLDYLAANHLDLIYNENEPIPNIPTEVMIACKDYIIIPSVWAAKLHELL